MSLKTIREEFGFRTELGSTKLNDVWKNARGESFLITYYDGECVHGLLKNFSLTRREYLSIKDFECRFCFLTSRNGGARKCYRPPFVKDAMDQVRAKFSMDGKKWADGRLGAIIKDNDGIAGTLYLNLKDLEPYTHCKVPV